MKERIHYILTALCITTLLTSCVNEISEEVIHEDLGTAHLNIQTRTNTSDSETILPIHIYAFNQAGTCAARQTLTEATEDISLELTSGTYTVYAFTGASEEVYELPAQEDARPGSLITLRSPGSHHAELEAGRANITLTDGETTDLLLTVSRLVARVNVQIKEVKEDITAVSLTLQPLYGNVSLDGGYTDDSSVSPAIDLSRSVDGIWSTETSVYILPGKENVTVTISLTDDSGTRKYAYNSGISIEANYKINIEATYNEVSGPDINGTIQSTDWAGERKLSFDFGPEGSQGKDNEGGLPKVGDTYKDCYVLDVTGNTILLVAPKQWENLSIEETLSGISTYETEGITGWQLPDPQQAEMLFNAAESIPEMDKTHEYLFVKDGVYRCFFDEAGFMTQKAGTKTKYYSRAVKVLMY